MIMPVKDQNFLQNVSMLENVSTVCSGLSSVLPSSNGNTFGKHSLIQRVLKKMLRLKPSLPCWTVTHDVKHVLNYIITNSVSGEVSVQLVSKF